jgi:hypothetical protein
MIASATCAGAQAAPPKTTPPAAAHKSLLPEALDGWVADGTAKELTDATQADAANAAALKEYSFSNGELATYKREGETLTIRALQFDDASGAYGAYSYYRQNGWPKEEIGAGATSDHNRVLFWKGLTVVDASFSRMGPMAAGEMRELAGQIADAEGSKAVLPPILGNLPQDHIEKQTTHYAEGPAGYAGGGGVLPAELIGFDRGAEAVTANYSLSSGPATLTIIDYPTPQMAEAQLPKIAAYLKAGGNAQPAWPKPLADSDAASLEVRRSGPLVAIVSGDAIPDESHRLLEMVHYEANIVAMPQSGTSDVQKTAKLLLGIAGLVIVGGSAALLLGFFLGGGRALYRIMRGKPASSVYDEEFIRIDLREDEEPRAGPARSGSAGENPKG